MKTAAQWFSLLLFLIVFCGVLRTIFERRFPFIREFSETTRHAYILLAVCAVALLAWAHFDLHLESVEIAGVKATVGHLQEKVETLSEQMEVFFKSKRIETFDRKNWNRVRKVGKAHFGVVLEVTLEQEPIPGSVEVYSGVLLMPETEYRIDGRIIRFPANSDNPDDETLTIKYYPRTTIAHR
jgi:hypothetical protein